MQNIMGLLFYNVIVRKKLTLTNSLYNEKLIAREIL